MFRRLIIVTLISLFLTVGIVSAASAQAIKVLVPKQNARVNLVTWSGSYYGNATTYNSYYRMYYKTFYVPSCHRTSVWVRYHNGSRWTGYQRVYIYGWWTKAIRIY